MFAGHMPVPGQVELVDIPEPELPSRDPDGPGQIIFQPTLACLCGSDLPFFQGSDEFPILEGHSLHEMIGRVVATNGDRYQVGDEVLAVPLEQRGLWWRKTGHPISSARSMECWCKSARPLPTGMR